MHSYKSLVLAVLATLPAQLALGAKIPRDTSPALEARANSLHIKFCTDKNFGGRCQEFDTVADNKCWNVQRDMNDAISSISVGGSGSGKCYFYEHDNCDSKNGDYLSFWGTQKSDNIACLFDNHWGDGCINDQTSSFKCCWFPDCKP